ncbi:surface-adhesin E family protein [Chromobacterium haemolyticum]|uniref:surface-adhesin E family protein n=1 Tax=Chromobacterium haemolyticum TaxID=394935 RepID=UPI004057B49D
MEIKVLKSFFCGFALCSSVACASSWDFTFFNPSEGGLLIDTDSIALSSHGTTKFWTLYAPKFETDSPMAGYAYSESLYEVNCQQRLIMLRLTLAFDVNDEAHETEFESAKMEDIQPDSQEDFLWTYICKPEKRPDMAVAMRQGIRGFLDEQRRYASEHLAYKLKQN